MPQNRIENTVKLDKHQNGGKKEAKTRDNWIILKPIIDNNRTLRTNTYILMADAEKCLGNLWLEDCLAGTKEAVMREREIHQTATYGKNWEKLCCCFWWGDF